MVRRLLWSAVIVLLVVVRPAGAEQVQRLTVHLGDYAFRPSTIEVVAGEPVELTLINDDRLTPHNLTLDAPAAGIHVDVDVGGHKEAVVDFTASRAGTYAFFCNKKLLFLRSHRDHGMVGKLVVRAAP